MKWVVVSVIVICLMIGCFWVCTSDWIINWALGIEQPVDTDYTDYYKSTVIAIDPDKRQLVEDRQSVWMTTVYLDSPELDYGNFKCVTSKECDVGDVIYLKCVPNEKRWYKIITEDEYNSVIDKQ